MRTARRWSSRLDDAVKQLASSTRSGRASADVLRKMTPSIDRQIRRCARYPELNGLWGRSANYDELAKGRIVAKPIVKLIGDLSGIRPVGETFHAGYLHTFGYLFSTLDTPYGLKRDRWIQPTLDDGLGFKTPTIRVHPKSGTLLTSLTWLLGSLVFEDDGPEADAMQTFAAIVPDAVTRYGRRKLKRARIVERPARTSVEIVTDLISTSKMTLLIYSSRDIASGRRQLFTAFPIEADFREALLDPHRFGPGKRDLQLRFNAVIEGLDADKMRGARALVQPA